MAEEPACGLTALERNSPAVGRLLSTLGVLLLFPVLLVLLIYTAMLPWYWSKPMQLSEAAIVCNFLSGLLFFEIFTATAGLRTLGAKRSWGRMVLGAVSSLSAVVALHGDAAMVYRLASGGLTPNRMTTFLWDLINVSTFTGVAWHCLRGNEEWVEQAERLLGWALLGYAAVSSVQLVLIPIVFHSPR